MRNFLLIIIAFIALQGVSQAQTFEYTANCKQAYQAIFKLKLNEGLLLIAKEKKDNPKNLLPYFIENYADFLKLYINDNEKLYASITPKFESRLDKLETGNKNSPYYLYTQADIHLQSALCKIKFGDYLSAVFEVKKAYAMLQDNQKKYPDFKPNLKSIGLLHTIFGAVPDKYKFGAKLLGLKGSIEEGLKELNTVMNDNSFEFKEETVIMYTLLVLHLQKDKTTAWNMIEHANIPLGDNLLNYFIAATVAKHTGKNDKVISILSQRPTSKEYYAFPFLDFLVGDAKLNKLDTDAATYILKFITNNKGRSYQKEAYRKLAWISLINGNAEAYKSNMKNILAIKDAPTDEDKSAQKEALQNNLPNRELLKARVLFDGAYFDKALITINAININSLQGSRNQIEYYYRKARIYDELNNTNDAIKYYLLTIQKGENDKYYFAANACIKLANIFEQQKKKNNAITYYNKAIALDKDEYTNSINAEAKAGLNRLGN
jgi:tetratricopeptide (TPR) repeat protein